MNNLPLAPNESRTFVLRHLWKRVYSDSERVCVINVLSRRGDCGCYQTHHVTSLQLRSCCHLGQGCRWNWSLAPDFFFSKLHPDINDLTILFLVYAITAARVRVEGSEPCVPPTSHSHQQPEAPVSERASWRD